MDPLILVLVGVGVLAIIVLILALFSGRSQEASIEERLDQFVTEREPERTDQQIEEAISHYDSALFLRRMKSG